MIAWGEGCCIDRGIQEPWRAYISDEWVQMQNTLDFLCQYNEYAQVPPVKVRSMDLSRSAF